MRRLSAYCKEIIDFGGNSTSHVPQHGAPSFPHTWFTSMVNELCGREEVSTVAIRVNMRSVKPMTAFSAGTNDPTCARYTATPT